MISKKFHSEQLLQLILALSLLRVDPTNYIDFGFETLVGRHGPTQILQPQITPLTENPYLYRKNYIPLIEDLARFDRHYNHHVEAYLLNVSDEKTVFSNPTNNSTNTSTPDTTTQTNNERNEGAFANIASLLQDRFIEHPNNDDDVFLNSQLFDQTESITDQNWQDLNDWQENELIPQSIALTYPTKPDPDSIDDLIETPLLLAAQSPLMNEDLNVNVVAANDTSDSGNNSGSENVTTFSRVINWTEYHNLNDTKKEDDQDVQPIKKETNDSNNNDVISSIELTAEEMDLIEVLWKQDVDLGYTPVIPATATAEPTKESEDTSDNIEKIKALLELKEDKNDKVEKSKDENSTDPWAGLSYVIDTETGEYILQSTSNEQNNALDDDDLLLEQALQLVDLANSDDINEKLDADTKEEESEISDLLDGTLDLEKIGLGEEASVSVEESDLDLDGADKCDIDSFDLSNLLDDSDDFDLLSEMMIQPSTTHFQHPRQPPNQNYVSHGMNAYRQSGYHHPQGRMPLSRSVSMEQRWQDLANLLSFPPGMGVGMGVAGDMSTTHAHYPTHYPYQTGSMTQHHGQFTHPHHPHSHPAVLHNATLAEITAQAPPPPPHHLTGAAPPYTSNLGSAVATSMHLTNSTSETDAGNSTYKMEHDLMYYSNTSSEMNHTSDGFLNSILNDEDLQLMDMAVNEGMYTMRMLDQNSTSNNSSVAGSINSSIPHINNTLLNSNQIMQNTGIGGTSNTTHHHGDRLDASSDSAVSSMGSERVASLSDGEWGEGGSDSAQDYHQTKYGPYDYRYSNRLHESRQPVAQKKHQMFGKRFVHEQTPIPPTLQQPQLGATDMNQSIPNVPLKYEPYEPYSVNLEGAVGSSKSALMDAEMKYSYSIDFPGNRGLKTGQGHGLGPVAQHDLINHNHTYTLPHQASGGPATRPQMRDKKIKKAEDEHLTRDEKRARSLQIPIPVQDIINLPMDEFNERLSKYDLSENQLSLIRDIRRRGKNKVAAQNCRKRKLDQIISLADEVKEMKMRKERLLREREHALSERRRVKDKFAALYRHVFQNLRDNDGNPYSSYQYSLQQTADGSVVLVPRTMENSGENGVGAPGTSSNSRNDGHPSQNNQHQRNSTNFK